MNSVSHCYGLFTLAYKDSVTDWEAKPDGYIVLCRNCFHYSDSDSDSDPDTYTDYYSTNFWDRYPFSKRNPSPCPVM